VIPGNGGYSVKAAERPNAWDLADILLRLLEAQPKMDRLVGVVSAPEFMTLVTLRQEARAVLTEWGA
jgi:hypothetical protein